MNGRIYDPLLARFITPDPFVQAPYDLQSHNRYSYVFNNPLRNVDPSGYWSLSKSLKKLGRSIKKAVRGIAGIIRGIAHAIKRYLPAIVAVGLAVATHGAVLMIPGAGSVAAGAAAGFVGGFVGSGGNLEAAIIGGLTGGALGAIGGAQLGATQTVVAKAAVGCVSSAASGGTCASGALSAGFSEWAGTKLPADPVAQAIGSAVIGGTASKIGGGSFANGAVTGSFAYMFDNQFRGTEDPRGRPLTATERNRYEGYISPQAMDNARIIEGEMPW